MKKWDVQGTLRTQNQELRTEDLLTVLLENRGLKTKKEIEGFLHPSLEDVTTQNVGIDTKQIAKALKRIQKAIKNKEHIVVFGDYDVDGICGSAILWETLRDLGASALPYIPHRIDEGYGLSIPGIENLKCQMPNVKLIITVDNGIVAHKAVEFANKNNIDVIITDHHVPSATLPKALAIVHTTKLCGAGVAWLLSQELRTLNKELKTKEDHLELVALATVADLVPLVGANRTLVKLGLEKLKTTKRPGLLELYKEAGIDTSKMDVYTIGHVIAPRLNAMGRLETAMDSLRLICTNNKARAENLAQVLGDTNRQRQQLTIETVQHAIAQIKNQPIDSARGEKSNLKNLLFISHESYQQGVIGLVAGKLVEQFYRPSIVLSIGEKYSKASARSISGFNIIEFIRSASEHLVDAGGHPMAAGFTVETAKITLLQKALEEKSLELLTEDLLIRTLRIDCGLPLQFVTQNLYQSLQLLSPFGMGNPEPTFVATDVVVDDVRTIGKERNHLKLQCTNKERSCVFDAVGFGLGDRITDIKSGSTIDIVYTIDENFWNGRKSLQLKIKDINLSRS